MELSPRDMRHFSSPPAVLSANSQSEPHDSVVAVVRNTVTHEHVRTHTQKNVATLIDSNPTFHALPCVSIRRPRNTEQRRWRRPSPVCLRCPLVGHNCTANQIAQHHCCCVSIQGLHLSQCESSASEGTFIEATFDGGTFIHPFQLTNGKIEPSLCFPVAV